jgi:hypothetical protein
MRRVEHLACMKQMRNVSKAVVGKPKGNRPVARPRHTREDNIKMDVE